MVYEGLRQKGSMIIVPSSAVEAMGLGALGGLTAFDRPLPDLCRPRLLRLKARQPIHHRPGARAVEQLTSLWKKKGQFEARFKFRRVSAGPHFLASARPRLGRRAPA